MTLLFRPTRAAIFDDSGRYRYVLRGRWVPELPSCNFVMLNPSTADEYQDDPTVRRCFDYAKRWGFGELIVTNIFAYRSTDPEALYDLKDPIGIENDAYLVDMAKQSRWVVCAWGRNGEYLDRGKKVIALLKRRKIELLQMQRPGYDYPMHPLYLPKHLEPVPVD